jgi:hypothetical protein
MYLTTETAEVTEKNWVSVLCILRVLFSRSQSFDNSSQRLHEEYPLGRFTTAIKAESFSDGQIIEDKALVKDK